VHAGVWLIYLYFSITATSNMEAAFFFLDNAQGVIVQFAAELASVHLAACSIWALGL
jgi:hypothetical protein